MRAPRAWTTLGAGALLAGVAFIADGASLMACRPGPDVPCRVRDARVLATMLSSATLGPAPGDRLVLGALHTALPTDAGASDAGDASNDGGDGGDGGYLPPPERLPDAFDVAVFDADGNEVERHDIPAPSALRARRGSTTEVAATWTTTGALFRWTETEVTTKDDGTRLSSARLVAEYVAVDGTEKPAFEVARCDACSLTSTAATGKDSVALVWVRGAATASDGLPSLGTGLVPSSGFVTWTPSGDVSGTGAASWLAPSLSDDAGLDGGLLVAATIGARVESLGDDLLVRANGRAWLVDARFAPIAGPVPAPNGSAIAWARGDVAVAFLGAAGALSSGATDPSGGSVGASADVDFRRYTENGAPRSSLTRVTTADIVAAVAGDPVSGYGVIALAGAHPWFAFAGGDGSKRGGDLDLGGPSAPTSSDADAPPGALGVASFAHHLARRGDVFVDVGATGGAVVRQEISCDP